MLNVIFIPSRNMVLCREGGVFCFVTVKSKYTYLSQQYDVKKVLICLDV